MLILIFTRHVCLHLIFHERGILPTATWGQCLAAARSWLGCGSRRVCAETAESPSCLDSLALLQGTPAASGGPMAGPCHRDVKIMGPGRKIIERFYRSLPYVGSLNHHSYLLFTEGETEAQTGKVTCVSYPQAEPGFPSLPKPSVLLCRLFQCVLKCSNPFCLRCLRGAREKVCGEGEQNKSRSRILPLTVPTL